MFSPFAIQKQRYIDVHIYFNENKIDKYYLDESMDKNTSLIIMPIVKELDVWITSNDALRRRLVGVSDGNSVNDISSRINDVLRVASSSGLLKDLGIPISINFARDFPVDNPFTIKYFHVYRSSVRDLMKVFERKNGVYLWCSVRRSGKTTACFDISSQIGSSVVVSQTCDSTHQGPNSSYFYDQVVSTIEQDVSISPSFFFDTVKYCIPEENKNISRVVFIIDEYETLFDHMNERMKKEAIKRYTFVQPLLNQMVNFSRQNLLIFVGQRPDAHCIIMDQNQLMPYVKQDAFPLFTHGTEINSEFGELIRKTLGDKVSYDNTFVAEIYKETAGHPYLTVKILVVFFDWLISNGRKYNELYFTDDDYKKFALEMLTPEKISLNTEFSLFHNAARDALSQVGKESHPWLYAVYSCLKNIGVKNYDTLAIKKVEFEGMFKDLLNPQEIGFSPADILRTGTMTNFLDYDKDYVRPKIPLLARICAVAMPKVRW